MRPRSVVIGDPSADELASLIKIGEQALVEKLVAHSAVEGLDVAVPSSDDRSASAETGT